MSGGSSAGTGTGTGTGTEERMDARAGQGADADTRTGTGGTDGAGALTQADAVLPRAALGPGTLLLVVGPSGAGKDTLIDLARVRFAGDGRVLFARRLVTRPPGAGEANGTLAAAEFEQGRAAGRFPLCWQAHGLSYALGPEVAQVIAAGGVAVANGSRATLPEARARFACVRVVEVTAPPAVRAARLAARGREDAADIEERLRRSPEVDVAPDLVIENVGSPAEGGAALAAFIAATLAPAPV